jgi:hypothetical protein
VALKPTFSAALRVRREAQQGRAFTKEPQDCDDASQA